MAKLINLDGIKPFNPFQQGGLRKPPFVRFPFHGKAVSSKPDRLELLFGSTPPSTGTSPTGLTADLADHVDDPTGLGKPSTNGLAHAAEEAAPVQTRNTRETKIEATIGDVFLLWMRGAHATPVGFPTIADTDSETLNDSLTAFLERERPNFVRLQDQDVELYRDQRFTPVNVRAALRHLENEGLLTLTNQNRDTDHKYTYQVTLTQAGLNKPLGTLEETLLKNVNWTRKVALEV